MDHKVRIAIIDEYPLYRVGIERAIATQPDMEVVSQGETAQDAIEIIKNNDPDVIIFSLSELSLDMRALEHIMLKSPSARILVLTPWADDEQARVILKNGVHGYLLKKANAAELIMTVRTLCRGESYISPNLAAKILSYPERQDNNRIGIFPGLSSREQQILAHLAAGMSNKEIALKLSISEKTIKHHVTKIFQKLQVRNRVEAALLASKRKLAQKSMLQQGSQKSIGSSHESHPSLTSKSLEELDTTLPGSRHLITIYR